MKKTILLLLILLLIPVAYAQQGHITLLTVSEIDDNETVGGTADLFLEIIPGTGRVFIDSFPLTQVDTQISTRFARDVACDFLEKDCTNKDFLYTIRAKVPIVGGPSAGGAITILTISLLDNRALDPSVVMTGTINAGGLIGPVAGIEEKATAAREAGFEKVLVPKWSIIPEKNETNETEMIIMYADTLTIEGIDLKTISTLEEAMFEFTGKTYKTYTDPIVIPEKYQTIMEKVANNLCDRYDEIKTKVSESIMLETNGTINATDTAKEKADNSLSSEDFYSAASYCFSANTRIRSAQFSNYTNSSLENIKEEIEEKVDILLAAAAAEKLETISDLETYIIVKERLYETQQMLKEDDALENLGYIYERMFSAVAWSAFFEYDEGPVDLNEEHLENACISKIAEAEERQSYVELLFRRQIGDPNQLSEVRKIYASGDYAFCLFRASKIKADANSVLSVQGLTSEKLPELVEDQLHVAQTQINKQGDKFPILGYSYYNYANSLKEDNPTLASLFSGYSNELSNLDMYFPKQKKFSIDITSLLTFELALGFMLGVLLSIIVLTYGKKK